MTPEQREQRRREVMEELVNWSDSDVLEEVKAKAFDRAVDRILDMEHNILHYGV